MFSGLCVAPRTAAGFGSRAWGQHQSGVDSEGTAMQGQPISDDLEPPVIDADNHQAEVSQAALVVTRPSFTAHSGGRPFEGAPATPRKVRTRPAKGPCCDSNLCGYSKCSHKRHQRGGLGVCKKYCGASWRAAGLLRSEGLRLTRGVWVCAIEASTTEWVRGIHCPVRLGAQRGTMPLLPCGQVPG